MTVADVCKTTYEEIKKDKKHRYVIFYIKDERQIDVEVIGPRDAAYDAFLEDLQKGGSGECRYGLFDFEYTHQCQGTSEVTIPFQRISLTDGTTSHDKASNYIALPFFPTGVEETEIVLDVVVSRHGQS